LTDHKKVLTAYALTRAVFAIAFTLILAGCGKPMVKTDSHEMLNSILWTQTSAEYIANTKQAYQMAAANLDQALADPQWTAALEQTGDYTGLPPAIIVDLDQTVLDNTAYNAEMIGDDQAHSQESHTNWCRNTTAPAIPGVKEFLDYAVERGVTVIYNSARHEEMRDCTTRNLQALGLPLPNQDLLLLADGTSGSAKVKHRARMCWQYRILLLVGDNLDDFVDGSMADPAARRALASQHAGRWGREWIILPNPMFGNWESSLYEFDYSMPMDERLDRKLQQLLQ
jgi:acid phosphatase